MIFTFLRCPHNLCCNRVHVLLAWTHWTPCCFSAEPKGLDPGQHPGAVAGFETVGPLKPDPAQSAAVAGTPRSLCRTGVWSSFLRHLALLLDLWRTPQPSCSRPWGAECLLGLQSKLSASAGSSHCWAAGGRDGLQTSGEQMKWL